MTVSSHIRRKWALLVFVAILISLSIASYLRLHLETKDLASLTKLHSTQAVLVAPVQPSTLKDSQSKYAYVSLLTVERDRDYGEDLNKDEYFVALRILVYQLLHCHETKSDGIPFVILAANGSSEAKKERLRRDGAIVVDIEPIPVADWIPPPERKTLAQLFDKLRVWELTQFDRIIFLDADVVLTQNIDALFESVLVQQSRVVPDDDRVLPMPPKEYIFTALAQPKWNHKFPPHEQDDFDRNPQYFNAGFFVTKPSVQMLEYYQAAMEIPDTFDTRLMEQDLLNHIHGWGHPEMPFEPLNAIWNMHWPTKADLDAGTHSLHTKWWAPDHEELSPYLQGWKGRMIGYFEAYDQAYFPLMI